LAASAQEDVSKNLVGISVGIVPPWWKMYFGDPFDFWPSRELSMHYQFSYARRVGQSAWFGPYLEYEKIRFSDQVNPDKHGFRRYSAGISWFSHYPQTMVHWQLGGYTSGGMLKADNWDNLYGVDVGIITGPAFETRHLGIAAHFQMGGGWFFSEGTPEIVIMHNPRVLLKVYFKL
jgi:hypothetical protein